MLKCRPYLPKAPTSCPPSIQNFELRPQQPIDPHHPRHPHTHPLSFHHTLTCLSSVASSPRKSVRQVAQLIGAQWKPRVTANECSIVAKPMWPFYVSGTSRTLNERH